MTDEKAGRALDARVAAEIFNLNVVALDWPCGFRYDGCTREAWSWPEETPPAHFEPWPVYVPEHGLWPGERMEPMIGEDEGQLHVRVSPVEDYEGDIGVAWNLINVVYDRWKASLVVGTLAQWEQEHLKCRFYAKLSAGNVAYERFDCTKAFTGNNPSELLCEAALYAAEHALEGRL